MMSPAIRMSLSWNTFQSDKLRIRSPGIWKTSSMRRHILVPPVSCREVNNSLFVYGLPDYTSRNPGNASVRSQLRLEIEKTISRFEPRLKNVTVHIDSRSANARDLGFRITAVLEVNPITEPVTFDTSFDLNRSKYSILK